MTNHLDRSEKLIVTPSSVIKFFTYIYIILLPIGTGLSGIIGNTSLLNYFALIIIIFGILNVISGSKTATTIKEVMVPTLLYLCSCLLTINKQFMNMQLGKGMLRH